MSTITPESRGCDARRCSKHVYTTDCEFCALPMSQHPTIANEDIKSLRAKLASISKEIDSMSDFLRAMKCAEER